MDMVAGGVAVGEALELGDGLAAKAGVAVIEKDKRAAEVTSRGRLTVFLEAGTIEKVHGSDRYIPPRPSVAPTLVFTPPLTPPLMSPLKSAPPCVPRRERRAADGDTERMKLSRPVSWFLLAFGAWSWVIWVTFVKNLWKDGSGLAFDDAGDPTAYFWVHLTLAVVSFVLGTVIGVIGLRGLRALRRSA
ncbi:hypothetical protein SGFS_073560 [Streptomyces graminofaciens]|uniref:Integral membrane protein n=2 Tax=Streptomyces graminofaciens TaxID=68212 RepID=A0ABN5VVV7_9ACTN|nr:hypothetical protein SGFS_073560 [Streptomyces graminofaciens]